MDESKYFSATIMNRKQSTDKVDIEKALHPRTTMSASKRPRAGRVELMKEAGENEEEANERKEQQMLFQAHRETAYGNIMSSTSIVERK